MSMTEPTPNLPLLRKVLDHIDAHPEEWEQATYATKKYADVARTVECGTAFCIAGWAAVLSGAAPYWPKGGKATSTFQTPDGELHDGDDLGREVLGLTESEAGDMHGLFSGNNTRDDVQFYAEQIAARAGERL